MKTHTHSPETLARISQHRAEWNEKQAEKLGRRKFNEGCRANRSPAQQLAYLDARLGEGVGAVKERARLMKGE